MRRIPLDHGRGAEEVEFEQRLDEALARATEPVISPEFALRVASMVSPRAPARLPRFAYASAAMIACGIALIVALFLLAPHAAPGSRFDVAFQWILCAQLSVLAISAALDRELWRLR